MKRESMTGMCFSLLVLIVEKENETRISQAELITQPLAVTGRATLLNLFILTP